MDNKVIDIGENARKLLLEHLVSQYRLYREEIRMYQGYAAASVAILIFLFIGEINAAKDLPKLFLLIPLTSLSYAALLGSFYSYSWIASHYSELLERKMNELIGSSEYIFENYYVGPKPHRGEEWAFNGLRFLVMSMPAAFTGYGMLRLFRDPKISVCLSWGILVFMILGFVVIGVAVNQIVRRRQRMNIKLLEEWEKRWDHTS